MSFRHQDISRQTKKSALKYVNCLSSAIFGLYLKKQQQPLLSPTARYNTWHVSETDFLHFPMQNLQIRNETDNLRTLGMSSHDVSYSLIMKQLQAVCWDDMKRVLVFWFRGELHMFTNFEFKTTSCEKTNNSWRFVIFYLLAGWLSGRMNYLVRLLESKFLPGLRTVGCSLCLMYFNIIILSIFFLQV